MLAKCEKEEVYIGVFRSTFLHFVSFFRISHFASFCAKNGILANCQKDFIFFCRFKIWMKYEKCIVDVSYFVVFYENIREISVKCEIR